MTRRATDRLRRRLPRWSPRIWVIVGINVLAGLLVLAVVAYLVRGVYELQGGRLW